MAANSIKGYDNSIENNEENEVVFFLLVVYIKDFSIFVDI